MPDVGSGAAQVGHRDRNAETQVAELFEKIRRDAKMPKLKRIDDRAELQQLACTVTVMGKSPEVGSVRLAVENFGVGGNCF